MGENERINIMLEMKLTEIASFDELKNLCQHEEGAEFGIKLKGKPESSIYDRVHVWYKLDEKKFLLYYYRENIEDIMSEDYMVNHSIFKDAIERKALLYFNCN